MKVLVVVDKPYWAYASIFHSLDKYNTTDVDMTMIPVKGKQDKIRGMSKKYDLFFVMGWQLYELVRFLPQDLTITGIHSAHSFAKDTTPEQDVEPPQKIVDYLNGFLRVNAVSGRLCDLFKRNGVDKIHHTSNGVDSELFVPKARDPNSTFSVGYSGSKNHDWRKGVSEFIIPSAEKAGVATKIAMLSTGSYIPLDEMPTFYQALDAYICASSSEGFSLSVLEAASCGVPVITTRVGGCTELIKDGENGFLVDRNVDAIADRIVALKNDDELRDRISKAIRKTVEDKYCWKHRAGDWFDFILDK